MSSASNDQGRAYEYICLLSLQSAIGKIRRSEIVINSSYHAAQHAWNTLSSNEQTLYTLSAKSTIETIFAMEPNIIEKGDDVLNLYIQTDKHGEDADVRDIIIERKDITWEIGLSIKHKQFSSSDYCDNNRGAFGKVYHTYLNSSKHLDKYADREVTDSPFYADIKLRGSDTNKWCIPIIGIWMSDYDLVRRKQDDN